MRKKSENRMSKQSDPLIGSILEGLTLTAFVAFFIMGALALVDAHFKVRSYTQSPNPSALKSVPGSHTVFVQSKPKQ